MLRRNWRAAKSASLHPTSRATTAIEASVVRRRQAIRSARSIAKYAIGDFPNASTNTLPNRDGDRCTAAASSRSVHLRR